MEFLRPNVLWGLWALPGLFLLSWHAHVRVRLAAHRFAGQVMTARLLPALSTRRALARATLLSTGCGLALVALAGPYWDTREEEVTARGVDVCVALDVSKSMLTENEPVRPLDRAKAIVERLVDTIRGDRVGLVLFAGTANVGCVLTQDQSFFKSVLRACSPADAGRGGTRIGDALVAALRLLDPGWARTHARVLQAIFDPNFVEGNRPRLEALLGTRDLQVAMANLVDPRWNAEHEAEMETLFGRDWRLAAAMEEDPPWFAGLDADDPAAELAKGGRVILLLTDGYDQESAPRLAARIAAARDVKIVAVGIGDPAHPEGRPLVLDGRPQRTASGEPITIRLDEDLLRELATVGRGMYVPPGELLQLPELYRTYVDPLDKRTSRSAVVPYPNDRFQWFLVPGIALLLLHACMRPYRAPRATAVATRSARAAGLAFLLGLGALGGCADGERAERRAEALAALTRGSFERADELLVALQKEAPEDARVAFDRGVALQALGRFDDARREYQKALTGARPLRARVLYHLGTLATDRLRSVVPRAARPAGTEGEFEAFAALDAQDRARVVEHAEEALAHFARAARLDPALGEAGRNRDRLGLWLALLRDRWSRIDREARLAELAEKPGPEFALALETWQRDIGTRLPMDAPVDLALEQGLLATQVETLLAKLEEPRANPDGAPQSAPSAEERDALLERARELAAPLSAAEEALRELDLARAASEIERAARDLLALWSRWADPAAVLERLRDDQRRLGESTAPWTAPDADADATSEAERVAGRRLRERLAQQLVAAEREVRERLADWAERARSRPLAADDPNVRAHHAWGVEATDRALAAAIERLVAEPFDGEAVARAQERATETLDEMLAALRWVEAQPAALAEAAAERAGSAAADARAGGGDDARDELGRAVRRVPFLASALERALQPAEEAGEAAAPQREALDGLLQGLSALRATCEALDGELAKTPETAAERVQEVANALWTLWSQLGTFDDLLKRAAARARESVERGDALRSRTPTDGEAVELRFAQGHVTFLAERLLERVPAEIERLRASTARGEDAGDPGTPPPADDEHAPVLRVFESAAPPLTVAVAQSREAEGHLAARELDEARSGQAEARDALERLRKDLEEARRPLVERLQELLTALREAPSFLDDLPDAQQEAEAHDARWNALEAAWRSWTTKSGKLDEAVRRFVAELRSQAEGEGGQAADPAEVEHALGAQMEAIRAAVAAIGPTLEARDVNGTRNALFAAHGAVREPWSALAELERMLREALAEQERWIAERAAIDEQGADAPAERTEGLVRWQARTRDLVEPMLRRAEAERAAAASAPAPDGGAAPEAASVPEKAIEKLPRVRDAQGEAGEHLAAREFADARAPQEEARRLLEEILERPPQDEDSQRSDDPEPSDEGRDESQPNQTPRTLSREEVQRLLRAAQERRPPPERDRTARRIPVEEDH